MAKNGGAVKKLSDKAKRNGSRFKLGTMTPVMVRCAKAGAHHEKAIMFEQHRRAIHGLIVRGVVVDEGGRNPGPEFGGKGLPDEVIKTPKSRAERAEADKRKPLKEEWREGFKPGSAKYVCKALRGRL